MSEYEESNYWLDREVEERVRRQEEERRREEKRRRLEQRIQRRIEINHTLLSNIGQALAILEKSEEYTFVNQQQKNLILQEYERLNRNNVAGSGVGRLEQMKSQIENLNRMLNEEIDAARSRLQDYREQMALERKRSQLRDDFRSFERQLKKLASSLDAQYVRHAIDEIGTLLQQFGLSLDQDDLDRASNLSKSAHNAFNRTIYLQQIKKEADLGVQNLVKEINNLNVHPVYRVWLSSKLGTLLDDLNHLRSAILDAKTADNESWNNALLSIQNRMEALIQEGDEQQQREEKRAEVIRVLVEVLREEGYTVKTGLEGTQDGPVLVTGTKPGRIRNQIAALRVGLDGKLEIDMDSGDDTDILKIREAQADPAKDQHVACEKAIQTLKSALNRKGVRLQTTHRKWHDPNRIAKAAKSLPGSRGNRIPR
ncbi:MAG: hypothetical protein AB1547_06570 [Thermodesulfobacteriota bacterium]